MAVFVHIFAERDRASIKRSGIRVVRGRRRRLNGVFVSPVTESYYHTHQWHREVRRMEQIPKLAARIRIPDDEKVCIGKYNEPHLEVTAAQAVAMARQHDSPEGLEVIIPRSVRFEEIISIYKPPKVTGWRYSPQAKGRKPCGCSFCQRGRPNSRKIRESCEEGT